MNPFSFLATPAEEPELIPMGDGIWLDAKNWRLYDGMCTSVAGMHRRAEYSTAIEWAIDRLIATYCE